MKRSWLLLPLLALAACNSSPNTTLELKNYDTACAVDADCKAVFVGDPCATACQCANAALNSSDYFREQSDLMAMTAICSNPPGTCTESCATPVPACNKGTCALP
jgi:hypothetical protein